MGLDQLRKYLGFSLYLFHFSFTVPLRKEVYTRSYKLTKKFYTSSCSIIYKGGSSHQLQCIYKEGLHQFLLIDKVDPMYTLTNSFIQILAKELDGNIKKLSLLCPLSSLVKPVIECRLNITPSSHIKLSEGYLSSRKLNNIHTLIKYKGWILNTRQ